MWLWIFFSDIDECTTAAHDCNAKETCGNTGGSFTCTCSAGYSDDGVKCNGKMFTFIVKYNVNIHFSLM